MNVGDTVVCILKGNNAFITPGKEYTIISVEDHWITILNDNCRTWQYYKTSFELKKIEEPKIDYMKAVKEICGSY